MSGVSAKTKTDPMEALLGPSLMHGKTHKATWNALKDAEVVALYFSASWCPPCKAFTPKLVEFYQIAEPLGVRIVFISSDRDEASHNAYYSNMPWYALPYATHEIQKQLAGRLSIRGIPALVLLDAKTGHFITDAGRTDVLNEYNGDAAKGHALVQSWKTKEAVPLDEAKFNQGQSGGGFFWQLLMQIMKNPLLVFVLMYFYKKAVKMLEGLGNEERS